MVQEHLPLPVNEQGLALCVDGEQQQAIRADAQISELSQTLEWQCRPSGLGQVCLQRKANRVKTCLNVAGQLPTIGLLKTRACSTRLPPADSKSDSTSRRFPPRYGEPSRFENL